MLLIILSHGIFRKTIFYYLLCSHKKGLNNNVLNDREPRENVAKELIILRTSSLTCLIFLFLLVQKHFPLNQVLLPLHLLVLGKRFFCQLNLVFLVRLYLFKNILIFFKWHKIKSMDQGFQQLLVLNFVLLEPKKWINIAVEFFKDLNII